MSADLERRATELAWRQWTALGVAGVAPPPNHALDLEALIAFMPFIAAAEPRLTSEALDWCVRFGPRFISRSRLRTILAMMPAVAGGVEVDLPRVALEPTGRRGARKDLSQKSRAPRLDQPVLLQLRSRQVFGVGARADVIAALVVRRREPIRISSIGLLGYTKPTVATVVDELASVGVLSKWSAGPVAHYVAEKREALRSLLAPIPAPPPSWPRRLALIAITLETWRRFGARVTYGVELAKALDRARPLTIGNEHEQPPTVGRPATMVADIDAWAALLLEA